MYARPILQTLKERLNDPRRYIQVLLGPRQVGKTTLARQVMEESPYPCHYASADEPALKDTTWIEQQWESARLLLRSGGEPGAGLLILDEIQKIPGWSETVKRLWDEDTLGKLPLNVLLLGSSTLLIKQGLTETLAGRFEMLYATHWSFKEMRDAFDFSLEQYLFFGGYPGAAPLIQDLPRWSNYIRESLIETTVSRDILLMTRVDKPALLRRLFDLGCAYSGQILSYQKMLGQLHEAGNTTTLAHYLSLLESAGMLAGLSKYSGKKIRQRASSPKFQVLNTALMSVQSGRTLKEIKETPEIWGRLFESAAGAALVNGLKGTQVNVHYWSERNHEVDFVLSLGEKLAAIEIKSGRRQVQLPGLEVFSKKFPVSRKYLVGKGGIPLKDFLSIPPGDLVR